MRTLTVPIEGQWDEGLQVISDDLGRDKVDLAGDVLRGFVTRQMWSVPAGEVRQQPGATCAGEPLELTDAVVQFATHYGVLDHLLRAMRLVRAHFPGGRIERVCVARDPEAGDEWLSIRLVFQGTSEAFMAAYRRYRDQFVSVVPSEARRKIHLSYGVAAP